MRYIKSALMRGGIPFVIMAGIALMMKAQEMGADQVKSTFVTGIIIAAVAAASVLYEIEGWSLAKQSAVHFLTMLFTVFPCLLLSGWFPAGAAADVLKVLGVFLLVGAVSWFLMFLLFRKVLKR